DAVGPATEVGGDRAHDRGLRDAGQPDQQDSLPPLDGGEQEPKLPSPADNLPRDLRRQLHCGTSRGNTADASPKAHRCKRRSARSSPRLTQPDVLVNWPKGGTSV